MECPRASWRRDLGLWDHRSELMPSWAANPSTLQSQLENHCLVLFLPLLKQVALQASHFLLKSY